MPNKHNVPAANFHLAAASCLTIFYPAKSMVSVIALPLPALDQLTQITEKLLAAEEKKLKVLKAEIQASKKHSDTREDAAKVSLIL